MPTVRIVANIGGPNLRRQKLHGKDYTIAPAAMMAEAVLNGSEGPGFYPKDEIADSVPNWDHKPIVAYHPENADGSKTSACDPDVLEAQQIGMMLNTNFDNKLRTECWIDEELCNKVDDRILVALQEGKQVEVSTGLRSRRIKGKGTYDGVAYNWTARNFKPDHLAVLYDQKGAYPIERGGGLMTVNAAKSKTKTEGAKRALERSVEKALEVIQGKLVNNELSLSDISCGLSELLSAKFGEPGKYWQGYICEVYSDRVVFWDGDDYWQIGYEVKDNEVALTATEAIEVEKVYQSVKGGETYATNNKAGDSDLNSKETANMAFDKAKHVAGLIGNGYEETDRKALEAMPDATLEKIKPTPAVVANADKGAETPPKDGAQKVTTETVPAVTTPPVQKATTLDDIIKNSDAQTGRMINRMKNGYLRARLKDIAKVKAATDKFSDAILANMDDEALEALAETVAPAQNQANDGGFGAFFGQQGNHFVGNTGGGSDEAALGMPSDHG